MKPILAIATVAGALILAPMLVHASPGLDLIQDHEWKAECRKVVNESGEEIKTQPYQRLQSSYSFHKGTLTWWVKSFDDLDCKKIHDTTQYSLKCKFKPKDVFAECSDGKDSDPLILKIRAAKGKDKTVELTSIGESDDPEMQVLKP